MSEGQPPRQRNKKMTFLVVFCAVLLALLTAFVVFFFVQYRNDKKGSSGDNKAMSEQVIKKVGKLYVLPTDDQPTVARIQNKESLPGDQEFYKGAENGDYVLVYTKSKIAILYRESINKLVRVSPVVPTATSDPLRSGGESR